MLSEQTNFGDTTLIFGFSDHWETKANIASRKAGKGKNLLLSQNSTCKTSVLSGKWTWFDWHSSKNLFGKEMRFQFLQFLTQKSNLSYKERRQKHIWSTTIMLTSKNEKKFYLKTIWLKVFKRNIEETSKILASWNFQNFLPILLQYFVANGHTCCAKNTSNNTGRINTRWKGHGIWQIMQEEIGNMQIRYFLGFQYVQSTSPAENGNKWVNWASQITAANNFKNDLWLNAI